jgi:hypothetical protein
VKPARHTLCDEAVVPGAIPLTGHSGAVVLLIHEPGHSFVRKRAGAAEQNIRLQAQCRKQQAQFESGLKLPRVISSGMAGGLFHFDMEYIAGASVAHECLGGHLPDSAGLATALRQFIGRYAQTAGTPIAPASFQDKLRAILAKCRGNKVVWTMLPALDAGLRRLAAQDWRGIPQSDCHGDLTLENILVHRGAYSFIDTDVPELESFVMDVGKLLQDVIGLWCLRHLALTAPGTVQYLNAQLSLARLRVTLQNALAEFLPATGNISSALAMLNLMRALPYCRDEATAVFILGRVDFILQQEGWPG